MKLREVMTENPVVCRSTDTLSTVAGLMWEHDCGVLPVVDESEHLVGIVTDRDVCMAAYTTGSRLDELGVSQAMSRQVFTLSPEAELEEATALMGDKQIRRIPITDASSRPVGLLSLNDIAMRLAGGNWPEHEEGDHGLVHALGAICRGRQEAVPPRH